MIEADGVRLARIRHGRDDWALSPFGD